MVSVRTSSPPTVHTKYTSGVSVTVLSAILRVWVWIFKTQVRASLVWKSTWKEKEDTVDCRSRNPSFLNAKYLLIVTSHTHCVYKPCAESSKCNLKKTNKSLLAQTLPALQPLPLAFCQLPIVSDFNICPKDDGGGQTSRFLSMRLCASYSHLGDIGRRKENTDGTAPTLGKCLAFLGFKQLVMEESTSF